MGGGEGRTTRGDLHQDSEDARLEGYSRRPADGAHLPTRFFARSLVGERLF